MKKIIFLCAGLLLSINMQSQSISPEVVAGSGDFFEGSGISISWTLGEPVVETFNNGGIILTQGFQQPSMLSLVNCQTLSLPLGWSIFSTYIEPVYPAVDSVFNAISTEVIIVKNGNGQVYWPQFGLNMIGNLIVGEGYQINMALAISHDICGLAVTPETTVINIPQGWSIVGYLRQSPADVELMMSSIVSDIIIMKNGNGLVYWPQFGLNMIGNLIPGEGYQINLSTAQSFSYSANYQSMKYSGYSMPQSEFLPQIKNTGSNMTLGIPLDSWERIPNPGDEILLKNQSGSIVGAGVFTGNNLAIAVWGNDILSDRIDGLLDYEKFSIFLRSASDKKEYSINVAYWQIGDENYSKDKISVVGCCEVNNLKDGYNQIYVRQYPNPFSDFCFIEFFIPNSEQVSLKIYNSLGKMVFEPFDRQFNIGNHCVKLHRKNLPPGNYFYRIITNSKTMTGKFTII